MYAYRDASGWHIERVGSAVNVNSISLALDGSGMSPYQLL